MCKGRRMKAEISAATMQRYFLKQRFNPALACKFSRHSRSPAMLWDCCAQAVRRGSRRRTIGQGFSVKLCTRGPAHAEQERCNDPDETRSSLTYKAQVASAGYQEITHARRSCCATELALMGVDLNVQMRPYPTHDPAVALFQRNHLQSQTM
jgi:hypothetical protein